MCVAVAVEQPCFLGARTNPPPRTSIYPYQDLFVQVPKALLPHHGAPGVAKRHPHVSQRAEPCRWRVPQWRWRTHVTAPWRSSSCARRATSAHRYERTCHRRCSSRPPRASHEKPWAVRQSQVAAAVGRFSTIYSSARARTTRRVALSEHAVERGVHLGLRNRAIQRVVPVIAAASEPLRARGRAVSAPQCTRGAHSFGGPALTPL